MGELISRSASEPGTWRTRSRVMLVAAVTLLLPATMAATAAAQDEPPKVEAPKAVPPPPPDLPGGLESAPQDVQKKDSTPLEQKKDAPTAPDDKEKAAPTAPADAQKPAAPAPDDARKNAEPPVTDADRKAALEAVGALSTRFKFVERYGVEDDPRQPQKLTQYRIGMLETTKYEIERPQGAPERNQRSRTIVYAERAAKVGKLGEPIDLIRRYDKVVLRDLVQARPVNPPLLQGLTIWYHHRPPLRPQIISLSPDRPIREDEYGMIEEEVSISNLIAFLPSTPKRVSETWEIPAGAIQSVSGRAPDPEGYELTGTLEQVTRSPDGNSSVAEIDIAGKFDVEGQPGAFHGRIIFEFVPRGVALPAAGAIEGASKVVTADGWIKRADLSLVRVGTLPEGDGRLKHKLTIELIVERRPMTLAAGEAGPAPAPLPLPSAPPTAVGNNAWIAYDDPDGRFHFRHPQEYIKKRPAIPVPSRIEFADVRPGAGDAGLVFMLPTRKGDPDAEKVFRDPVSLKKGVDEEWLRSQFDVTRGPAGWLDDADWKDSKRRVYRIEAALKQRDKHPVYADIYLVEFNQTQRVVVHSYTERTDHLVVRKNVEDVIRSFQWGPSTRASAPGAAAPATTTAPAAGATTPAAAENPANPAAPPVAPAAAPNTPPG